MPTITPHIVVRDAARAADWYAAAFGFEEVTRLALPDGKLMSVALRLGDAELSLADEFPELGVLSPLAVEGDVSPVALVIATDDADGLWARALAAGAEVHRPLQDAFWGERHGQVMDPFGHRWGIAQHLRDVPREELERAAADAFGF
jgi:PhnB protein